MEMINIMCRSLEFWGLSRVPDKEISERNRPLLIFTLQQWEEKMLSEARKLRREYEESNVECAW